MRVVVTGASGFLGRNLRAHLAERKDLEVVTYTRHDNLTSLHALLRDAAVVFHLAGVNRPQDPKEFETGNAELTIALCESIAASGRKIPVIYASSTQAVRDNAYGASKRAAEIALFRMQREIGAPAHVFRLPNVFGKWCRPNYNSVVATFCHNIARNLPIQVNDPNMPLTLVYVDDVVERFIQLMDGADRALDSEGFEIVTPQYSTTVKDLAAQIAAFRDSRLNLGTERVGSGLARALYSTYMSYLPTQDFSYRLPQHSDARGTFVEMLKTPDCGQFAFFTAHPGVTRGGHYHHSKIEKFLVVKGQARFRFRHIGTGETYELATRGELAEVVETVPGWAHDVTNVGTDELVVMIWANEVFNRLRPDTYSCSL